MLTNIPFYFFPAPTLKVALENLILTRPLVLFVPISDLFRARHKKNTIAAKMNTVMPKDTAIAT